MKLCCTVLTVGAVVAALFAVLLQGLSAEFCFDIVTRLLYPLSRVLWSTGIGGKLFFARIDNTNFTFPRMLKTPWEVVKQWQPGEEDVIIVTYPKSGTHMMMQMVTQIASNASELTADFENIHNFVCAVEIISKEAVDRDGNTKALHLQNYKEIAVLRPWLHHTHLDREHTPISPAARYIVVARDPADVLVSFHAHMAKALGRLVYTKEEGVEILQTAFGGWAEWYLDWWRHRHDSNVLFLFFEDIVKDKSSAIAAVTRFMGREPDADVMARVAARTDIKYMKERAAAFEPPFRVRFGQVQAPGKDFEMVSQGKSGRGGKELSEAAKEEVRSYCRRVLGGTDFPLAKFSGC